MVDFLLFVGNWLLLRPEAALAEGSILLSVKADLLELIISISSLPFIIIFISIFIMIVVMLLMS